MIALFVGLIRRTRAMHRRVLSFFAVVGIIFSQGVKRMLMLSFALKRN